MRKLYIIGQINEKAYKAFSKELDQLIDEDSSSPVHIELHSEGGNASDGLAFHGKILACPAPVHIHAHGMVQSAAVAVLAAGTYREATPECSIMVHDGLTTITGTARELIRKAEQLMDDERAWDTLMERGTGTPAFFWRQLSEQETYLTAQQALQYGLVDKIIKGKR